jgi:glucokinase
MLLAGDIGGTKTTLAIYSTEKGPGAPLSKATFRSADYPSLEAVAQVFMRQIGPASGGLAAPSVDRACFGVSGPVVMGRATITNLPWVMDESDLAAALNVKAVRLLNDLESIAMAVPIIEADKLQTLNPGVAVAEGSIAVIAPGTGLGEAYLTWDGMRYRAHACEGGHADFAPTNEIEIGLLHYLLHRFEHVSYERVCSGIGLPNLYHYIRDSGYADEPAWLSESLSAAADQAPVIVKAALEAKPGSELCVATLNLFVSILGSEAGNLALKLGALGGVYLAGGIPHRILPALAGGRFMKAFRLKGRLSNILASVPVHVILDPEAGLSGAAHYGRDLMAV